MNEFQVAGGVDFPEQQVQQHVEHAPPPEPAISLEWWMGAVIVPILVAWIMTRRRQR